MKCKVCKDKPIGKGFKRLYCEICGYGYTNSMYTSSVCTKCSVKKLLCEYCGDKLDKNLTGDENINNVEVKFNVLNKGIKNIENLINEPITMNGKPIGVILKVSQSNRYLDFINCEGIVWNRYSQLLCTTNTPENYGIEPYLGSNIYE